MTCFNFNHTVLILFCIAISSMLSAQSSSTHLFSKYNVTYSDLAFEQRREVDRIAEDELIVFQQFGTMSDISTIHQNGEITLLHPETDEVLMLKPRYTEFREHGYSWYGEGVVQASNADLNRIPISLYYTRDSDFFLGSLRIGEVNYQFEYIGNNRTVIYRLDTSIHNQPICGNVNASSTIIEVPTSSSHVNCDVEIVAMFTERFRNKLDGFWNNWTTKTKAVIRHEFFRTQLSRILSSLDVEFEIKLVGIETSDFEELTGADIDDEKSNRFTPSFQSGEMNNIRYQYTADIVVLFTHGKYIQDDTEEEERIGGSSGTTEIDPSLAYVIIEKLGLKDRRNVGFTLPHELFHLFSAQHTAQPFSTPYAEFHEIPKSGNPLVPQTFGTLMIPGPVTGRFHRKGLSNPDILFEGELLGIAEERDNARTVSDQVCKVSNYRSKSEPQFGVNLFYDDPICLCAEVLLSKLCLIMALPLLTFNGLPVWMVDSTILILEVIQHKKSFQYLVLEIMIKFG